MAMPIWIKEVQALSTPLVAAGAACVAGIGVWFARQQAYIARQKLKLDLFERRFLIYEHFQKLVTRTLANFWPENTDVLAEKGATLLRQSRFLFNETTFELLSELIGKLGHLDILWKQGSQTETNIEALNQSIVVRKLWNKIMEELIPYLSVDDTLKISRK